MNNSFVVILNPDHSKITKFFILCSCEQPKAFLCEFSLMSSKWLSDWKEEISFEMDEQEETCCKIRSRNGNLQDWLWPEKTKRAKNRSKVSATAVYIKTQGRDKQREGLQKDNNTVIPYRLWLIAGLAKGTAQGHPDVFQKVIVKLCMSTIFYMYVHYWRHKNSRYFIPAFSPENIIIGLWLYIKFNFILLRLCKKKTRRIGAKHYPLNVFPWQAVSLGV